MSIELMNRAKEIVTNANMPDRSSFFQIEKFVIGKEVTLQAQLWQIIREIEVRVDTVESFEEQLEDAEDTLEFFDVKIAKYNLRINKLRENFDDENQDHFSKELAGLEMKENEINIKKMQRKKASLVKASKKVVKKRKSYLEEINCLIAAFDKVFEVAGIVKPFDDYESQKEMWNEKYLEEFNLRMMLNKPLDSEFVKCIMALGDDAPVKQHVVRALTERQKMMIEHAEKISLNTQQANKKELKPTAVAKTNNGKFIGAKRR